MIKDIYKVMLLSIIVLLVAYIVRLTGNYDAPIHIEDTITYYVATADNAELDYDAAWQANSQYDTEAITETTDVIWYRIPLPIYAKDTSLYFTDIACYAFELYTPSDSLLYTKLIPQSPYSETTLMLKLHDSLSSKTLYLKVYPTINHRGIKSPVYIGDDQVLQNLYSHLNIMDVYLGLSIMFCGLMIFIISFFIKRDMKAMSFSLGFILVSFGFNILYSKTNVRFYFDGIQALLQMVSLAAFVLGSIGVTIYIKHALYPKTPKKHLRYLLAFQLSVALITLIYSFFILTGFEMPVQIKIYHMKTLFGILFSIQLLVITLILLKEANDNHYVAKRLLLVFLTLCITLVIDFVILSLPENNYGALSTWKWGILVCIVTFTAIYIHRALNYKKDISNLKNVPASHMHTGASKSSSKQDIPDYLTGLLTRPSIYRLIESTLETSKLTKASFTLAFCDVDDLKSINNNYDYQFADTILVSIVNILKNNLDPSAIIGRWAGEEFAIILPQTTTDEAKLLLENIREKVKYNGYTYHGQLVHVTITFGLYTYMEDDTFNQILSRAEQSLYFGKRHGKDTTINYSDINISHIASDTNM